MPQNGRLPASALAPIAGGYLRRDAAAAFNAMNAEAQRRFGITARPGGPMSAYRTIGQQVFLWNLYRSGRGNLAARPGTSNHGWGLAVDLASQEMRHVVDEIGAPYGFAKRWSDAPSEWWHIRWREGVWDGRGRVDERFPTLHPGERGRAVKRLQKLLRRKGYTLPVTGHFGPPTAKAVRAYQARKHLTVDGVVGPATWARLRRPPGRPAPRPAPRPASGVLHGPDVSMHQGDIDWKKVKASGCEFAFVKATEGQDFVDPTFGPGRWKAMRQAGLVRGAYHFARPSPGSNDPAGEAGDFHAAVRHAGGLHDGDLPLVLDLEATVLSARDTIQWVHRFVGEVRR
ncbi:MAG TPA: GH25 family lysozyme, partial [Thermoleophilaceae bacterium]